MIGLMAQIAALRDELELARAERDEAKADAEDLFDMRYQRDAANQRADAAEAELADLKRRIEEKGGGADAPTEWAYLQIAESNRKHRERADRAEVALQEAESLARGALAAFEARYETTYNRQRFDVISVKHMTRKALSVMAEDTADAISALREKLRVSS